MSAYRRFMIGAITALALWAASDVSAVANESDTDLVHVVEISGTIDLGLSAFLQRELDDAATAGAVAVIIDMDTPGGRLDAAVDMRDSLLRSPVPVHTLVDTTALSAGALLALATDTIAMTPGAVIGAATPISGATGETADAKTISAVRGLFEATAEARGRDPVIAAAMVDTAIAIDGVTSQGELLTLTTSQAQATGIADHAVNDLAQFLDQLGLDTATTERITPGLSESLVRVLTSPGVAGLLLLATIGLFIAEFTAGAGGLLALGGAATLALFLWGHLLAGLAGWEDLVLLGIGVALILLEVLVIPGFGVAGILGVLTAGTGLVLALLGRDLTYAPDGTVTTAIITVAVVAVGAVAATMVMIVVMGSRAHLTRVDRGLMLRSTVSGGEAPTDRPRRWLNRFGANDRLPRDAPVDRSSPDN